MTRALVPALVAALLLLGCDEAPPESAAPPQEPVEATPAVVPEPAPVPEPVPVERAPVLRLVSEGSQLYIVRGDERRRVPASSGGRGGIGNSPRPGDHLPKYAMSFPLNADGTRRVVYVGNGGRLDAYAKLLEWPADGAPELPDDPIEARRILRARGQARLLWEGQPREVGRPHIGGGSSRAYQMHDVDGDGHLDIVQTSVSFAGDVGGTTTRRRVFALRGDAFEHLRARPPTAAADATAARAATALAVPLERIGLGPAVPLAVTYFRRRRVVEPEGLTGVLTGRGDPVASISFAGPSVAIARVASEGGGPDVEHFVRFDGAGEAATATDLGLTGATPVAAQGSAPCRAAFSERSMLRSTEWTGDGVERALVYTWFRTPTELVGRLYRVRDASIEAVGEPMLLERCGEEARDVLVHPVVGGGTPELETLALEDSELSAWGG